MALATPVSRRLNSERIAWVVIILNRRQVVVPALLALVIIALWLATKDHSLISSRGQLLPTKTALLAKAASAPPSSNGGEQDYSVPMSKTSKLSLAYTYPSKRLKLTAHSASDCDNCDPPTFYSDPNRDAATQVLEDAARKQSDSTNSEQSHSKSADSNGTFTPRILQVSPKQSIRVLEPVDSGFSYSPTAWNDGVLTIENSAHQNLKVSLHGPGAAGAVIDGQPVVEGQQYDINGAVQIKSPQPMGVHIRSGGPSVSTLPDSNG